MMKVVVANPPLFEKIDAKFKIANKPVFFTFGSKIYNPMGATIHPSIMRHEEVHMLRQGTLVEAWWDKYIDDEKFRFQEELAAHKAEWRWWRESAEGKKAVKGWRSMADYQLHHIAARLASPLYGNMIKLKEAKLEIVRCD